MHCNHFAATLVDSSTRRLRGGKLRFNQAAFYAACSRAPLPPLIRAKLRFCARLRIIPCAPQKQIRRCARPRSKRRVQCAGDLLQIIKGCSAKPAPAARHGYIICSYHCPRNNVVQCNNTRSRNMAAGTPHRQTPLKASRPSCHPERSDERIARHEVEGSCRGCNRVMV